MTAYVNLQAILEDYRRQAEQKDITSSQKRIVTLRKEEERLRGQRP